MLINFLLGKVWLQTNKTNLRIGERLEEIGIIYSLLVANSPGALLLPPITNSLYSGACITIDYYLRCVLKQETILMDNTLNATIPDDVAATLAPTSPVWIILLISLYAWPYFSTFCHELGHFVCAKLVGLSPQLMRVGSGFSIFRKNFFGAKLELCMLPYGGLTYAYYPDTNWSKFEDLKPQMIIYIIGGCIANSILLACSIMLLIYTGFPLCLYFVWIEVLMMLNVIIPNDASLYGMKLPSDGKRIFFILTRNYQRFFFADHQKEISRIAGDRGEPQTLFKNDIRTLELFVKAETELNHRHFDKAISILNQLLNAENASDVEKAYILNLLASIAINHGQKQYLAQADGWSQEAMKFAGYSKTTQGTRGMILIELGRYEEGKQILLPLTGPGNDPYDIAISSYYLAKADHCLGNGEQAQRWLNQAKQVSKKIHYPSEMLTGIKQ
jgi:tetratricopeptide (TPR) repeat protein